MCTVRSFIGLSPLVTCLMTLTLMACSSPQPPAMSSPQPFAMSGIESIKQAVDTEAEYIIGQSDTLSIFVWRNPEISTTVAVRPDGKISTPLVDDIAAVGRTPTELARMIEEKLAEYIRTPKVNVVVSRFLGLFSQQIRVVGQAAEPKAIPYRSSISLLDVMIEVEGLGEFASGNNAKIVRWVDGVQRDFPVRLDDLLDDGDMSQNILMHPGDVLIIPESWF